MAPNLLYRLSSFGLRSTSYHSSALASVDLIKTFLSDCNLQTSLCAHVAVAVDFRSWSDLIACGAAFGDLLPSTDIQSVVSDGHVADIRLTGMLLPSDFCLMMPVLTDIYYEPRWRFLPPHSFTVFSMDSSLKVLDSHCVLLNT